MPVAVYFVTASTISGGEGEREQKALTAGMMDVSLDRQLSGECQKKREGWE